MAYVKQVDLVQAVRNPDPKNMDTVATPRWIIEAIMQGAIVQYDDGEVDVIRQNGSSVRCKVGDWIVQDHCGGLDVVEYEAFNSSYTPVARI